MVPLTVLQSYRQGVRVWGEAGMDSLWSAATVKLVGAGIDDAEFAEDISRLVGEHDVAVRSYADGSGDGRQRSSRSVTTSLRRQRLLPAEDLRAMSKGTALVLATGLRVAQVRLEPYYETPAGRTDR
ncbi:TraG/TraD/VirD4 family protein [Quadrisphaera oryzae]|uniref:TraG/TraD/VirD4 family protein n=1 Tax=Quadrisphaera TaxID=317661 RepID=UPI001647172E|nr:TraM recognition domain-containing protein [Quadrisphaera sp. RL12-1S]